MAEMRLPSSAAWSGERRLTGTSARSSSPRVSWPCASSQRLRPPASVASTTSFTLPPCCARMLRTPRIGSFVKATARRGPSGAFQGSVTSSLVASWSAENAALRSRPIASAAARGRVSARQVEATPRARVAISSPRARAKRRRASGSSRSRRTPRATRGAGLGSRSSSVSSSCAPAMPSIMQWWTFWNSAVRPSARPSSRCISQSGRSRSRGSANRCATASRSSLSPPGAGSPQRVT